MSKKSAWEPHWRVQVRGSSCESGLRPSQLWSASQLLPGTRWSFRRSRELPPAAPPGPYVLCSSLEVSQAERSLLLKCGWRRREGKPLAGCTLGRGEPQRPSPLLPRSPPGGRDTPWPFLDGRAGERRLRRVLSRIQEGRQVSLQDKAAAPPCPPGHTTRRGEGPLSTATGILF